MKKLALIIAMGAFTLAGVSASGYPDQEEAVQLVQDKVEIAPEDLPQAVKDTIAESDETKDLTISKAYQMTDDEGNVIYKVKFGEGEDSIVKKYDAEGNEIKKEE